MMYLGGHGSVRLDFRLRQSAILLLASHGCPVLPLRVILNSVEERSARLLCEMMAPVLKHRIYDWL